MAARKTFPDLGPDLKSVRLTIPVTQGSHTSLVLMAEALGCGKTELARRLLLDGIRNLANTAAS